jgi:sulfur-oxidizing protein SoxZ
MRGPLGDARIRIPDRIKRGDLITVNAIIAHPMDTGFFRTANGEPIPAYFVKDVVVTYAGQDVAHFAWTSGISRDPVVSFTLRTDKEAPLAITWTDTRGNVVRRSVDIVFT